MKFISFFVLLFLLVSCEMKPGDDLFGGNNKNSKTSTTKSILPSPNS